MMTKYPCTHTDGTTDNRYSVTLEWTGEEKRQYVARFCGDWIGSSSFLSSAILLAVSEKTRRNGALCIEAVESEVTL